METRLTTSSFNKLLLLALVAWLTSVALAQEGGGRVIIKAAPTAPTAPTTPTFKPPSNKVVVQRKSAGVTAKATATTGFLSVASESKTSLSVEPLNGAEILSGTIEPGERLFVFDKLKPGRYKVSAELDGYEEKAGEVTIVAGRPASLTLSLKPITYNVTIKTNVPAGDVRYGAPGAVMSTVVIQSGQAVLPNLRAGEYDLDIRAADAAYKIFKAKIAVGNGKTEFPVALERALCENTFSEAWLNLGGWAAPAGWTASARKLTIKAPGVALPTEECPQHFGDAELTSDVKLLNNIGIAFVLRALDKNNYYLVQLTGAQADEPYVLRGYAVQNGRRQQLGRSIPIDAFTQSITGKYFSVVLKHVGNKISVIINDSETGQELPLGDLIDSGNFFKVGAVGLAALGQEQNEVVRFVVRPLTGAQ